MTLDLGVRYEYFPLVTRDDGRGVERLDLDTMDVLLGGVGDVPRNVGLKTRKTDFAPRLGVAWRVNELTVAAHRIRADLQPAAVCPAAARRLSADHPQHLRQPQQLAAVRHARSRAFRNSPVRGRTRAASPLPNTATMRTPDPDNVHRGYIQSWNARLRAAAAVRHVGQRRLCRHEDDARLRQHRAERVASGRRRAGARLLRGVRAHGLDDALWRLEQEPSITRCSCS